MRSSKGSSRSRDQTWSPALAGGFFTTSATCWQAGSLPLAPPFASSVQFSSVAQSCPTLRPHESQHARPPCPSPTPGVYNYLGFCLSVSHEMVLTRVINELYVFKFNGFHSALISFVYNAIFDIIHLIPFLETCLLSSRPLCLYVLIHL